MHGFTQCIKLAPKMLNRRDCACCHTEKQNIKKQKVVDLDQTCISCSL